MRDVSMIAKIESKSVTKKDEHRIQTVITLIPRPSRRCIFSGERPESVTIVLNSSRSAKKHEFTFPNFDESARSILSTLESSAVFFNSISN